MKDLLYFPGFEIKDTAWLKFALLYLDELRPIIPEMPYNKNEYLSDTALMIQTETNLIKPYTPNYEDGTVASIIACEEFDRYLAHPERYTPFFGRAKAFAHINHKWTNATNHTTTLFNGKYSYVFSDYCLDNKIATRCNEGIKLPDELAFVYMAFLADTIAKNKDWEMITDIKRYSATLRANDIQLSNIGGQKLEVVKNHIELQLPTNLRNIPMEKIIALRKQRSFNQCRQAFLKEIVKLFKAKEDGIEFSFNDYLSYQKDFLSICGHSFDMLASTTMFAYSAYAITSEIGNPTSLIPAVATTYNEIRAIKDAVIAMPKFIQSLNNKRQARRYVAKLNNINKRG